MRSRCFVPILLFTIASAVIPPADAETLSEVVSAAKKYDAAYRAAIAQHESVLTRRDQARADLLPRLAAYGNANWNDMRTSYDKDVQPGFTRTFNTDGFTIQLTQPLFQLTSIANFSQSRYIVKQSAARSAQAESDLILRVAQAYFDLLLAKDTRENIVAQKKAIKEQMAAAEKGYKVGSSSRIDVLESRAKYELVRAQEIEIDNGIDNKRKALRAIAGRDTGDPQPVEADPELGKAAGMNDFLAKLEENFAVQAARAALDVAEKEISKSKAGYFPSLDLVASYSDNLQGPDENDPDSVNIRIRNTLAGIQVQVPLFTGGATMAKVQESKKLCDKAREELEDTRRQISLQISQAFTGVVSGVARISALEAGVSSSRMALQSNTRGYRAGIRSNLDVLNSQQQLYSAMTDLNMARYGAWVQLLKLQLLVGNVHISDPATREDTKKKAAPQISSDVSSANPGSSARKGT